ncbi:MAG: hypothetical protein K8W52_33565 [Deltaproteobacteria bacterium]|nr:hypothetical protein [Deltaproteobacteria bacterium]
MGLAAAVLWAGACVQPADPNYPTSTGLYQPPQPQAMEAPRTLGLWKSNFGAVKLEEDVQRGGPGGGQLQGVWVYQRNGADVIGYFAGKLEGNVLRFTWQEPSDGAPLVGAGYLVFETSGQRFSGRWWTTARDRMGEWTGWRANAQPADPNAAPAQPDPYGGQGYGAYPPPTDYPNSY